MDDKKNRILEVAEKEFAHFGIKKTTMDDIAKKAKMGKSTLYYYFQSKEEVFAGVIKKDSQLFRQKLNDAITGAESPQQKLVKYVVTRMTHLKELSNYYTTLTDEYLEQYAFTDKTRKDFIDFEIMTLSNILKDGVEKKLFEVDDIELTARNLSIALKGLEYPLIIQNGSLDIEKESGNMLKILFRGIEVR